MIHDKVTMLGDPIHSHCFGSDFPCGENFSSTFPSRWESSPRMRDENQRQQDQRKADAEEYALASAEMVVAIAKILLKSLKKRSSFHCSLYLLLYSI